MDQNAPKFEYPTSTADDGIAFQSSYPMQTNFETLGGEFHPQSLQHHMDWLSANGGQYYLSGQDCLSSLQQPFNDSNISDSQQYHATSCYRPQTDLSQSSPYPTQVYPLCGSPSQLSQPYDGLLTVDGSSEPRPASAGTMLDSGSSNESRQSSISSSPPSRASKFKVPAIRTSFDDKIPMSGLSSAPLNDGIQVAPDTDGMSALSSEWMHVHDSSEQHSLHGSAISAVSMKASPALLEPFQWQQPQPRRSSISSSVTGPVFSPCGTPMSTVWQQSIMDSPHFSTADWTPVSSTSRTPASPHSPYSQRVSKTWSRTQYLQWLRANKNLKPTSATISAGLKPNTRSSVIDRFALTHGTRRRAHNTNTSHPVSATTPQRELPAFHVDALYSPSIPHAGYHGGEVHTPPRSILPSSAVQTPTTQLPTTPRVNLPSNTTSYNFSPAYAYTTPIPQLPTNALPSTSNTNPIPTPAHQPPLPIPSEPPVSDFLVNSTTTSSSSSSGANHLPASGPIRQSPHFEGDIYTPRFKRRNAAGKWEGWCGYCQPGRWLDLKNSRYWEDKLRNHGICARTKTFFEGPLRVRWVSDRGTIWEGEAGDSGFDVCGKDGIDDDGIGRKREGLCGECNTWVGMDGMRSRGKGRCVAWWTHAYKCHEQSKSRTDGAGTFEQ